ncbi:MAG TPA: DNA repair exonuclease [Candidatus Krumholzibacteriaceae bacterium]|nr:DNA repair exonuclease [Candidatus Krumholzibacteriaceae bacterium]
MKILHTADIHLKDYQDERWKTLQRLIEIAREEEVGIFVISGDLFDHDIDGDALRPEIRGLFSNNRFKVILIPGNHDIESYAGGEYLGEDVVKLTDLKEPYNYEDLSIWGLPFENIEGEQILRKLDWLADNLEKGKKNILLFHGELLDAFFRRKDFGSEGEGRYMPVKLSYFKGLNLDYVLAGHFHSKFRVWEIENGGYFVYPGSPVSITKRETGRRKINIFEPGKTPGEYSLDTPHFEEVDIELDPFKDDDPLKMITRRLEEIHHGARVILRISGFIDSRKINLNETELAGEISKISEGKVFEKNLEFRDINTFESALFEDFRNKLEGKGFDEVKKKDLLNLTLRAMMRG